MINKVFGEGRQAHGKRLAEVLRLQRSSACCFAFRCGCSDDAAWAPESDSSSSSFSFSFSAPTAEPAVPARDLPPVAVLFLYAVEYEHAVSDGSLPRALDQWMRTRAEQNPQGRRYVASVARVNKERVQCAAAPVAPAAASEVQKPELSGAERGSACACKSSSTNSSSSCESNGTGSCCSTSSTSSCSPAASIPASIDPAVLSAHAVSPAQAALDPSPPLLYSSDPSCYPAADPLLRFTLGGFTFYLPQSLAGDRDQLSKLQVVWIGASSDHRLLTNCMLQFNTLSFHLYNAVTQRLTQNLRSVSKQLARRFYLMEKVKNAQRVGILVGTLGVGQWTSDNYEWGRN